MKTLHYLFVATMVVIASAAFYFILRTEPPKQKAVQGVTRNAVTREELLESIDVVQQAQEQDQKIDWSAISAGIIAVIGAGGAIVSRINTSRNEKFQDGVGEKFVEVGVKFEGIYHILDDFKDTQYRRSVDMELSKIGFEIMGFVKDDDLRVFLEGVVERTRNFTRDTIRHKFDEDALGNAISKMGARTVECKTQVKNLEFDLQFEEIINDVRLKNLNILLENLKALAGDKEYNDKYIRYQDTVCRFLKSFLRDIIYAHIEYLKGNV